MAKIIVKVGEDCVTLCSDNSSQYNSVGILGVDKTPGGNIKRIYLDSFVHNDKDEFIGWSASGAISTILSAAG